MALPLGVYGVTEMSALSRCVETWRSVFLLGQWTASWSARTFLLRFIWSNTRYSTSYFPLPFPATNRRSALLVELCEAIESKDQAKAMAVVKSWEIAKNLAKPIFDCLRRYAVSEDGALHAEKYFRTVTEEFATTRPEFRWRHLTALARVSASEYGWPAPGREQARELLRNAHMTNASQ